jgi:Cupin
VDALAGFLNGARARGAFLLRSVMDPPWSLRIRDEAPLTIAAVVRGTAWVSYDDDQRVMHTGDVAIMRGPDHYTVADSPNRAPQVIIGPGQVCTTIDGVNVADAMSQGVRTWGNTPRARP